MEMKHDTSRGTVSLLGMNEMVPRRKFISTFGRIIGLGIVVNHIAPLQLLASTTGCENGLPSAGDICMGSMGGQVDKCPGGGDDVDVCQTLVDPDECPGGAANTDNCTMGGDDDLCPGEAPPSDECDSGTNEDDQCNTGSPNADSCPDGANTSDKCESGNNTDDYCPGDGGSNEDRCYTGTQADDNCNANTPTEAQGDSCNGGSDQTDNCEGSVQPPVEGTDSCPASGTLPMTNEDDCHGTPEEQDECNLLNDDTCIEGTNSDDGAGFTDYCSSTTVPGTGGTSLGSDQCNDGSDAQDTCIDDPSNGLYDSCPGGGGDVDTCDKGVEGGAASDDYCNTSTPNSDECDASRGEDDACPGGDNQEDSCDPNYPADDVCNPESPSSDECTSGRADEDECPGGANDQDTCNPQVSGSDVPE